MKEKMRLQDESNDWNFELLDAFNREIGRIAGNFGLDTYPNQIEVIRSDQMLDAYSSVGMPLGYSHWSYGKKFVELEQNYARGKMGLAYEIVINSNPCIAYLMEENTLTMQALVIAHACYGHNSFFKGNYLFQTWTDAGGIIDYLLFAKDYVAQCEEKHGIENVERVLDACHALMNYGVDRYKRPYPVSAEEECNAISMNCGEPYPNKTTLSPRWLKSSFLRSPKRISFTLLKRTPPCLSSGSES